MSDQTLVRPDGRTVGFRVFGEPEGTPVLWCHGGPGSRLQGAQQGWDGSGLRVIGIDRPGYGLSTPLPGRSIADGAADALAVADALGLSRMFVVGVSTGGAYALAIAAQAPERVDGVVVSCGMTDMRHPEARASMSGPTTADIWNAPDRAAALAVAAEVVGDNGARMLRAFANLPAADLKAVSAPPAPGAIPPAEHQAANFAWGTQGYVDDRRADGVGWVSFDVGRVACPVTLVHGEADTIVPVVSARHTARLVPRAQLLTYPELGHLSIGPQAVAALKAMVAKA